MSAPEVTVQHLGPLTPREAEALLWIAQGKTSREAGRILGITEATACAHITHAAEKLQASNRQHLVARAFMVGILSRAIPTLLLAAVLAQVITGNIDPARCSVRPCRRRLVAAALAIKNPAEAGTGKRAILGADDYRSHTTSLDAV